MELVEGARGEFTIWVEDELVAQKDAAGFPSDENALAAIQQVLARD